MSPQISMPPLSLSYEIEDAVLIHLSKETNQVELKYFNDHKKFKCTTTDKTVAEICSFACKFINTWGKKELDIDVKVSQSVRSA